MVFNAWVNGVQSQGDFLEYHKYDQEGKRSDLPPKRGGGEGPKTTRRGAQFEIGNASCQTRGQVERAFM